MSRRHASLLAAVTAAAFSVGPSVFLGRRPVIWNGTAKRGNRRSRSRWNYNR